MKFFDGAFGTYYDKFSDNTYITELANIEDKKTVLKIHREYIAAGVDYITTNTYNANLQSLSDKELELVIKNGFNIAKEATNDTNVEVLASIGYVDMDIAEYIIIVDHFLEEGSTNFIFESFPTLECLTSIINYIKEKVTDPFIIVSFSPAQDGYTETGEYFLDLINSAYNNRNINLIGLNCSIGPSQYINLVKKMDLKFIKKLIVMPNANYPIKVNNRLVFESNSDYFSDKILELFKMGVRNIGGCCGTTPLHIQKTIEKINRLGSISYLPKKKLYKSDTTHNTILNRDSKLIAVELDSPTNHDFSHVLEMGKKLKNKNIDLITIADSPLARTRMDSLISSIKLKRDLKIEVLPHLNCRDRNTLSIKAGLLGIVSEDINQVLVITGDPMVGRKEKGVFELNSFNMISYISSLNKEVFPEKELVISAALNLNANNFNHELNRAKKKIDMGAEVFFTQPIYENTAIENLKMAKETLSVKIMAGILPVANYRNGRFLNNEVAGINIPMDILENLNTPDKEEVRRKTIEYSCSIIDKIYDIADGFYMMIPLKRIDLVLELIDYIKGKE